MYIYAVVCKVDGPSPVLAVLDLNVLEVGRVVFDISYLSSLRGRLKLSEGGFPHGFLKFPSQR